MQEYADWRSYLHSNLANLRAIYLAESVLCEEYANVHIASVKRQTVPHDAQGLRHS